MSTLLPYATFQRARRVSVWIGGFRTAEELDDYLCLSGRFETEFGFSLSDRNMPETVIEAEPKKVEELLGGFSWASQYLDEAVSAARRAGIASATTMVVFHHFDYDPARMSRDSKPMLTFLGAFSFGE